LAAEPVRDYRSTTYVGSFEPAQEFGARVRAEAFRRSLGHSANAVKWQVWTALLVHLLLRFLAWQSRWAHSFTRLVTYIRSALWLDRNVHSLIEACGTANGPCRCLGSPEQAWLPGFARNPVGQPL